MRLGNIPLVQRVYFYKRKNGVVFACSANEAYTIHNKYEYVGTSSGETYVAMMLAEVERQKAILDKTSPSKMAAVEAKLMKDSEAMFLTAQNAELEEAKKDQTPPPNNQMHVEGQRNSFIDRQLSQIIGR